MIWVKRTCHSCMGIGLEWQDDPNVPEYDSAQTCVFCGGLGIVNVARNCDIHGVAAPMFSVGVLDAIAWATGMTYLQPGGA